MNPHRLQAKYGGEVFAKRVKPDVLGRDKSFVADGFLAAPGSAANVDPIGGLGVSGFLFIVPRFRLELAYRTPPRDDALVLWLTFALYRPGIGTCTRLDSCHARHTREVNSPRHLRPGGVGLGRADGANTW